MEMKDIIEKGIKTLKVLTQLLWNTQELIVKMFIFMKQFYKDT